MILEYILELVQCGFSPVRQESISRNQSVFHIKNEVIVKTKQNWCYGKKINQMSSTSTVS